MYGTYMYIYVQMPAYHVLIRQRAQAPHDHPSFVRGRTHRQPEYMYLEMGLITRRAGSGCLSSPRRPRRRRGEGNRTSRCTDGVHLSTQLRLFSISHMSRS